jgi:hypothetical protein
VLLSAQIPSPQDQFGFRMGADRLLVSAEGIEQYFELVASQSDRVRVVDLGSSTEGHRTLAAIVSAPENIRDLESIRTANLRLADPRTLPPDEAKRLAATQKTIVAIGASIHASEIGATQAANELLFTLASSNDPGTLNVLKNVVVIVIPLLNPDGHRLVTDWYSRNKGTPFEGGPMPWLYHKYRGPRHQSRCVHDEPRGKSQPREVPLFELASAGVPHDASNGENGPRFFRPPNTDPIDLNYGPLIWRSAAFSATRWRWNCSARARAYSRMRSTTTTGPGSRIRRRLYNTVCLTRGRGVDVAHRLP